LWSNRGFGDKWAWLDDRAGASLMSKILNLSAHTSDDELQQITNLLLFHLVERSGGQIQFKLEDANRVRERLTTKMVQMQVGDEVRLRIIDRLPELS
jgi:hypothetical protein